MLEAPSSFLGYDKACIDKPVAVCSRVTAQLWARIMIASDCLQSALSMKFLVGRQHCRDGKRVGLVQAQRVRR